MRISSELRHRRESVWLTGVLCFLVACMAVLARDPLHWVGLVSCALGAGALLIALWQRDALQTHEVVGLAIAFRLAFLPMLPVLSDDAYRYVWDGLLQAEGINPYRYRPDALELSAWHDAHIYQHLNSAAYYSVYPPISQWVFAIGGLFYDAGWQVSYFVIKGLFASMEVGGVYLLATLVPARNVMLYAWHPLSALESAGQGHTEAAVVLFGMAALWSVRHDRGVLAALSIAAAAWVKLIPIVLLPLLWRRYGWRPFGYAAALSVGVWIPYFSLEAARHFAASLTLYVQLFEFNAGFYFALKELFAIATGADWSKTLGPALGIAYGLAAMSCYVLDARYRWSFAGSAVCLLGFFFLFTTTIHPWYFLMLLPFAVVVYPPVWAIWWLALCGVATYLFYVGGPYWSLVAVGWGGAAVFLVLQQGDSMLQWVMRTRARRKAERLLAPLQRLLDGSVNPRILDLGAGEGYVGAHLHEFGYGNVMLADVVDMNRTTLPHVTYDGQTLPFEDDRFDITLLYFVLHHTEDPEQVLREARRVSKRGVIVVESIVSGPWQRRILHTMDKAANRLRSGGVMANQEEELNFRTPGGWVSLAQRIGARILHDERADSLIHPTQLLTLK